MDNKIQQTEPTMTSLQIAEVTGKQHRHVLAAIRKMETAWHSATGSNFRLSEYTDPTGRTLPCYALTQLECLYISSKFNDEQRAKLVKRWYELETQRTNQAAQEPQRITFPTTIDHWDYNSTLTTKQQRYASSVLKECAASLGSIIERIQRIATMMIRYGSENEAVAAESFIGQVRKLSLAQGFCIVTSNDYNRFSNL